MRNVSWPVVESMLLALANNLVDMNNILRLIMKIAFQGLEMLPEFMVE